MEKSSIGPDHEGVLFFVPSLPALFMVYASLRNLTENEFAEMSSDANESHRIAAHLNGVLLLAIHFWKGTGGA